MKWKHARGRDNCNPVAFTEISEQFMILTGKPVEERNIILTVETSSSLCTSSWQFLWPPDVHPQGKVNYMKVPLL